MRRPRLLVAVLICAIVPTSVAGGQAKNHAAKPTKP
jgi:hypothetical protein